MQTHDLLPQISEYLGYRYVHMTSSICLEKNKKRIHEKYLIYGKLLVIEMHWGIFFSSNK
jgi:hypothetical protein